MKTKRKRKRKDGKRMVALGLNVPLSESDWKDLEAARPARADGKEHEPMDEGEARMLLSVLVWEGLGKILEKVRGVARERRRAGEERMVAE